MKKLSERFKRLFKAESEDNETATEASEYIEVNSGAGEDGNAKVIVRPFVMEDFADIKVILDTLRTGNTIALINIKPLKDKDMIELKRAISKLKKTCSAIDGDIAGFGDDYLVVVPPFAKIYKAKGTSAQDVAEPAEEEEDK